MSNMTSIELDADEMKHLATQIKVQQIKEKVEQINAVKKNIDEGKFTIQNAAEHKARMMGLLNSSDTVSNNT